MQGYGYPNWGYWGGYGAQPTYPSYPPYPQYPQPYPYMPNPMGAPYSCQACNVYGHDAAYCPNKGWRWENGKWEYCAPPIQGSYEANVESPHCAPEESTPARENEKREEELRKQIEVLEARISEQEANEAKDYDSDCPITPKAEPRVDPSPSCPFALPKTTPRVDPALSCPLVSPLVPETKPQVDTRPLASLHSIGPCLISSHRLLVPPLFPRPTIPSMVLVEPEPERKAKSTLITEPSRYPLSVLDVTEVTLVEEDVRVNEDFRSKEDKMDVLVEQDQEYAPRFFRVYEQHDRGPSSSYNSKHLESLLGLYSIFRLSKRHIDAILDKRIIEEDWGASLSYSLPSSVRFEFCFVL